MSAFVSISLVLEHGYEQDKVYGNEPSDFSNDEEFTEEIKGCYCIKEFFALCI
jgi:hypothetical protein